MSVRYLEPQFKDFDIYMIIFERLMYNFVHSSVHFASDHEVAARSFATNYRRHSTWFNAERTRCIHCTHTLRLRCRNNICVVTYVS